jgi:tetratricopeptide (TPR) repeat protein
MLSPAQESLALASEASDKRDIAIARFCVGNALRLRGGDDELAHFLLEQSLAEFQALDEPFWQVQAFIYLGSPSQAKVRRRLELARTAGERLSLADALADYAQWLFGINRIQEATNYAEESDRLYKQIGSSNSSVNPLLFAEIAWSNGDFGKARSLYMELQERFSLLGERFWKARCMENLGRLAMEEGNLHEAQAHLERALIMKREVGYKPVIASCLLYLSNLFYLQGNLEKFKQNFRESLSFRNYFDKSQKASILLIILGSLFLQKPESAARLSGAIDLYKRNSDIAFRPLDKRYARHAETHARKSLGHVAFEAAFAEGQEMSLDEALDLAWKTVEET